MSTSGSRIALAVAGKQVAGDAGTYPVHDPGRPAEVALEAPWSSLEQVDRAVVAAAAAAPAWAATPLAERAAQLIAAAEVATEAAASADLASLLTRENGKVLAEAQFELAMPAAIAATFADLATGALADRDGAGGGQIVARPYGVVAALLPFNWPVSVLISKVSPALLAGNTIVVKPPPTCPGAALAVAAAMASALPPGVVNTVNGPGIDVGEALINHPLVAMITLTGGSRTGRAVMRAAAERLIPVHLELGGNDPAIVAPDVEPDETLAGALLAAAFGSSGQVCMAIKRLYVPAERLDDFVEALIEQAAATVTGYGLDPTATLGPVHTAAAAQRAESLLDALAGCGAGVHRPGRLAVGAAEAGGYYVSPAIVAAPPPDAAVVVDEQFAPLLPVLGYHELDDAVAAANASSYGLAASVWSADDELATAVGCRLEAGTVFRNSHGPGALDPRFSFGGWKESGIGREFGVDGVLAYTRQQVSQPPRPLPSSGR